MIMGVARARGSLRTLVVDDNRGTRDLLRALVHSDGAIEVVAEAEDGEDAIRQATIAHPDVVVLDVDMPGVDGITAIAGLTAIDPATRIVMFSAFADRREEALAAGAHAWVGKGEPWSVLRAAILGSELAPA